MAGSGAVVPESGASPAWISSHRVDSTHPTLTRPPYPGEITPPARRQAPRCRKCTHARTTCISRQLEGAGTFCLPDAEVAHVASYSSIYTLHGAAVRCIVTGSDGRSITAAPEPSPEQEHSRGK